MKPFPIKLGLSYTEHILRTDISDYHNFLTHTELILPTQKGE